MPRIDFYNVDGKIFCGEITFHPGSGLHLIIPKKWDLKKVSIYNYNNDKNMNKL